MELRPFGAVEIAANVRIEAETVRCNFPNLASDRCDHIGIFLEMFFGLQGVAFSPREDPETRLSAAFLRLLRTRDVTRLHLLTQCSQDAIGNDEILDFLFSGANRDEEGQLLLNNPGINSRFVELLIMKKPAKEHDYEGEGQNMSASR